MKEVEMGAAYYMHRRYDKCIQNFSQKIRRKDTTQKT